MPDDFRDDCPVDLQAAAGVVAGLVDFEDAVVAVAAVPDIGVDAFAALEVVVVALAFERVGAGQAVEAVLFGAALQGVGGVGAEDDARGSASSSDDYRINR